MLILLAAGCGGTGETGAGQAPAAIAQAAPAVVALASPATAPPLSPPAASATPLPTSLAPTATAAPTEPAPTAMPTTDERLPLNRTLNILILGSDRRPSEPNWRTDVMMIVALDLQEQRAGIISIPRDVYLDAIPNHRPNRINVLDYLGEQDEPNGGGPKLIMQIIEQRLKISIDHYLRFDFNSFQKAVDALGGVQIEVDCPFYDAPAPNQIVKLDPGPHRLSGAEALRYVRHRKIGGDLDRARRQQRFVWAVRNQILDENLLPRIPALYGALVDSIQTDIGIVNALRIVRFALGVKGADVHGFVIAPPNLVTEGWRQGMFVFIPDWPAIADAVQRIFDRAPFTETNTPTRCP
ncbi:MAG: LCP family protein [Caldilineaceae bacterium]